MRQDISTLASAGGDDGDDDERNKADAGIARGAAQSIGKSLDKSVRTVAKFPSVRRRITTSRRVPVRRVAQISDKVSQGLEYYGYASETQWKSSRAWRFIHCTYNVLYY
jgi:hypothetical protein